MTGEVEMVMVEEGSEGGKIVRGKGRERPTVGERTGILVSDSPPTAKPPPVAKATQTDSGGFNANLIHSLPLSLSLSSLCACGTFNSALLFCGRAVKLRPVDTDILPLP